MIIINGCGCFEDTTFMQGSKGFRPFSDFMRKIGCEEYYKNKYYESVEFNIPKRNQEKAIVLGFNLALLDTTYVDSTNAFIAKELW